MSPFMGEVCERGMELESVWEWFRGESLLEVVVAF